MKIKVWTDDNNRLLNWAYMDEARPIGPTDDGQRIIEVDSTDGLYENHSSIIDNKVVMDSGYNPEDSLPKLGPSLNQQLTDLQSQNAQLQSALLEIADMVLK